VRPHAVSSWNGNTYWYDANGNQTSRFSGVTVDNLHYDAENRLIEVERNTSGNIVATFVYDGDGNRVKATLSGVTTYYVGNYFEWTGSTSTMVKYYYAGGQRIAMRKGNPGTVYWLLGDHLGSTAITAYSSGSKKAELRYHPWGATRYSSGTTPTDRQFTGQVNDVEIGLYFYQARYYDGALGRFIQADSIVPSPQDPQSLNRYSYTLNNPLKYTDPTGHIHFLATAAIGALVGGAVDFTRQVAPQLRSGTSVQELDIDWSRVAGATASGGVMGLTMGVGAALGITSLGATTAVGAVGGLFGGQAGAYTKAATAELLSGQDWDSTHVLQEAKKNGLQNPVQMIIDAGSGASAAVLGHGITKMFQDAQIMPSPPQGLAKPSYTLQFHIHGEPYLVSDANLIYGSTSAFTAGSWEVLEGTFEEAVQITSSNLFEGYHSWINREHQVE